MFRENKGGHVCGIKYAIKSQFEQHVKIVPEVTTFPSQIWQIDVVHEKRRPHACNTCAMTFFKKGLFKLTFKGKL